MKCGKRYGMKYQQMACIRKIANYSVVLIADEQRENKQRELTNAINKILAAGKHSKRNV